MNSRNGREIQAEVYLGQGPSWVKDPDQWEAEAAQVLERPAFDYIAGGAGGEETMRANREAFGRWRLRPKMLTGVTDPDPSVELFGTRCPAPFLLAPIGVQTIAQKDGELAVARAAAETRVPLLISTASSFPVEDIVGAMGNSPRWYQLYWVNDRDVVASFVSRAEAAGAGAIVVTLDTLILGWRVRDLNQRYLPFLNGAGIAQFTSDPVFRNRLERAPEDDPAAACAAMIGMFSHPALCWSDMAWLRKRTKLPLLAKGILTPEDAARAVGVGFDGVIVSNHGGRQVDGAIAALDALPSVRAALGPSATILMDSGIRRAADVLKALALGANAVLLGRPYMYGLAVGGQQGVEQVVQSLMAEIDVMLTLIGADSARELDRTWIVHRPRGENLA